MINYTYHIKYNKFDNINNQQIDKYSRKDIYNNNKIIKKQKILSYDVNLLNKKYSEPYWALHDNILYKFIEKVNAENLLMENIIKNRFIYDIITLEWVLIIYNYIIKKYNIDKLDIALISRNYCIYEVFKIYGYDINIYMSISDTGIFRTPNQLFLLKDTLILDKYKPKVNKYINSNSINKKYNSIFYDAFVSYYYKLYDKPYEIILQLIKQREYINCILLEDMYNVLNNLELNGILVFLYPLVSNNCSTLLIESILNCFNDISVTVTSRRSGFMCVNVYICKGYKGKQEKLKHNTKHFYDFIQKLNKKNDKNNDNILLNRQAIDILLKHNPQCHELESRYLVNRHNCFLMMKEYKIETIEESIEKKVMDVFKKIVLRTNNYSRKVKVRCATIYPPNEPETKHICEQDYAGILYDIFIYKPSKKDIKNILPYNSMYIKIQEKTIKSKYYDRIMKYIEKSNTNNPIKLFLSNVDFKKKDIMLYIDDTKLFEKEIKLFLDNNKIKHIHDNKYDNNKSKCIITNICNISDLEFYKKVLKTIKALNNDDDLIIKISFPIVSKLILDLMYILYCSFNTIYIDYPKSFDKCVYIYFVKHKKNISIEKVIELNENEDLTYSAIIPDPYINEFKDEFIEVMHNFLYTIIIQNELINHISENFDILKCRKFI